LKARHSAEPFNFKPANSLFEIICNHIIAKVLA